MNYKESYVHLISTDSVYSLKGACFIYALVIGDLLISIYYRGAIISTILYTNCIITGTLFAKYIYTIRVIERYNMTSYFDMILDRWKTGDYMFVANSLDQLSTQQSSLFLTRIHTTNLKDVEVLTKLVNVNNK